MEELIEIGKSFTPDLKLKKGCKPLTMIWVPPGDFIMGKNHVDLKITASEAHKLYIKEVPSIISKGFWLSQFQATCEHCKSAGILANQWSKGGDFPFLTVNWLDAIRFCKSLNIRYKTLLPTGYHFSLPTELQWEYASKSGKEHDEQHLSFNKFVNKYSPFHTKKVGSDRLPNNWGFYDMLENSPEYCYDRAGHPFSLPWEGEEEVYEIQGEKVVDWVSNKPEETEFYWDEHYTYRVIKGWYGSTQRFVAAPKISLNTFRLCLRPIIDAPHCDLDDPWLKLAGIKILGDEVD